MPLAPKTEDTNKYWQKWWDDQARHSTSDYELNRRTAVRVQGLEEKAFRQLLAAVNPHPEDHVLDAGCGSGRNSALLSPLVREVVAMDYSAQMIARAHERVQQDRIINVKLLQGDITRLPFPDRNFEKVVCASVLQYLDNQSCARALDEMLRVCKPGGRLVLHIKNGTSLYGLSLKVLRPVARLLGKQMKPEFYRSRAWYLQHLARKGAVLLDADGFGIFNFVPLPARVVGWLIRTETALPLPRFLKRFAVNTQVTLQLPAAE